MAEQSNLDAVRKKLTRWFARQLPDAEQITVSDLRMPGAGTSNETYFLQLSRTENGVRIEQELVIRWQPRGFLVFPLDAYDMKQQFLLQQSLADTDVPVPPVCWQEADAGVIGAPFYIMERVNGIILRSNKGFAVVESQSNGSSSSNR